jgi:DNA-binding NtrC family response regulator
MIVDDDVMVASSLAEFLEGEGYASMVAYDADAALAQLGRLASLREEYSASDPDRDPPASAMPAEPAIMICDLALPGIDGLELLQRVHRAHPAIVVLMLTGYGTIEAAVRALRLGASDFLTKPVVDGELRLALERALRQHTLLAENFSLKRRLDIGRALRAIVGTDARMVRALDLVRAVAPARTTVLMQGESGVGKSLVARAIHEASPRRARPFVELACGSIPETLLESELFGHVKGAFTGAHADKVGRFQAADGGTLFLDEINSASPGMQLKLLRVLQERRFEAVGSTKTIEVDARVVLASNQPLDQLVAQGLFRQDLYYRINVVSIELPPLRERPSDIPVLALHFLRELGPEVGKQLIGFTDEALDALQRYRFPGNVRELRNVIERAAVLTTSPTIGIESLPETLSRPSMVTSPLPSGSSPSPADAPWIPTPLEEALKVPEREILLRALRANLWNRVKTADQLAINRTTLYKKMKLLGIDAADEPEPSPASMDASAQSLASGPASVSATAPNPTTSQLRRIAG